MDFNLPTGTLTFAAGETTKDLALVRFSDGRPEGPETISLALSNPTGGATLGAQRTMLITILGAESAVGFSRPGFSVTEGTAMAALTVTRTGPLTSAATVQVRTLDLAGGGSVAVPGVDYLPLPPTTLTFPPGMASRPVAVPILNNTRRDGARTVALALSNPSAGLALGTQQTTVLAIADNDAPGTVGFSADSVTVSDAAAVATLTVTRTGSGLAGGVSVDFVADFFDGFFGITRRQSGLVVFAPGQTSRTIALALNTDPLVRNERAFVQLTNLTGGATLGRSRTQVVVTDKDAGGTLRFATSAVTAVEGSTLLLTVTRTGGLAGGVGVTFAITDGSVGGFSARIGLDFLAAPGNPVLRRGRDEQEHRDPHPGRWAAGRPRVVPGVDGQSHRRRGQGDAEQRPRDDRRHRSRRRLRPRLCLRRRAHDGGHRHRAALGAADRDGHRAVPDHRGRRQRHRGAGRGLPPDAEDASRSGLASPPRR